MSRSSKRHQSKEAVSVHLPFKRVTDIGMLHYSLRLLILLLLALGSSRESQGQTVTPQYETVTLTSGTKPETWIGPIVSIDQDNLYLFAKGIGSIQQGGYVLATGNPNTAFLSVIKTRFNGASYWARNIEGDAYVREMVKMPDGGIALAGHFTGSITLQASATTTNTLTSNGGHDYFVARYSPSGQLLWAKSGGGTQDDVVVNLAADQLGNIAVIGTFGGPAIIDVTPILDQGLFVALYQSSGTLSWIKSINGSESFGTVIAMDGLGHIYAGGGFRGLVNAFGNTLKTYWYEHYFGTPQYPFIDHIEPLLMRFDLEGKCEWIRKRDAYTGYISNIRTRGFDGIICSGNASWSLSYGSYNYSGLPMTIHNPNDPSFVGLVNPSGDWVWAANVPGDFDRYISSLDVDPNGEIYVGGYFWGEMQFSDPTFVSDFVVDSYGNREYRGTAYVLRLSPNGQPAWGIKFSQQNVGAVRVIQGDYGFFTLAPYNGWYGHGYSYGWGYGYSYAYAFGYNYGQSLYTGLSSQLGRFKPPTALQLVSAPTKTNAVEGEPVSLRVVVVGTSPTYQWYKDGKAIPGANSSVYGIDDPHRNHEGNYYVVITNPTGSITTTPVFLGIYNRPVFDAVPAATAKPHGASITLQALASGRPSPAIRWFRDDGSKPDQTGKTFQLNGLTLADEGDYTVEASNVVGTNYAHFRISVDMIPVTGVGDFVHDPYRDVVYASSGSEVTRFYLPTKTFLTPFTLGGSLQGLDISPDGRYLVVADSSDQGSNNRAFVVNLDTDAHTEVLFQKQSGEGAFGSVAFGADGRAVLASVGQLRSFDPVTSTALLINQPGSSLLRPSTDQQTIALLELNNTSGTLHRYTVASTNITTSASAGTGVTGTDVAVDRTGQRFARLNDGQAVFFDSALQLAGTLGNGAGDGPGGIAYHPQQDIVYVPWLGSTDVRAYNADTLTELARYKVDNLNLTTNARVRLSRSGDLLLTELPDGIRYTQLPAQPPLILRQPQPVVINAGNTVVFSLFAYGPAGTLVYQWQKNGEDIPNQTGPSLLLATVGSTALGDYRVRVSNGFGTVYSQTVPLVVLQGDPLVTWNNPADIAYGTLLTGIQLNATAITAGTFSYDPPAGTRMPVGSGQPLRVIFDPADNAFNRVTNTVFINVQKKPLTITTPNVSRQFGLVNPSFPLTIFGLLEGDSLASIDALPGVSTTATISSSVGTYPITISGGSDDNYSFIYGPATLTITKRSVSILLDELNQPYDGTPRPISAFTTPTDVPLTITYNGLTTVPTARGSYPVTASVSDANYQGSVSSTLTIFKGNAVITWNTPEPVLIGTPLGATQLSAVAAVPGIYSYTPSSGTVLPAGAHTLTLVFTPLDTSNYLRSTNTVPFLVEPLALVAPQISSNAPGEFRFDFNGVNGVQYNVEVSTDLLNWSVLSTFTATTGSVPIIDNSILLNSRRFYRITPKP